MLLSEKIPLTLTLPNPGPMVSNIRRAAYYVLLESFSIGGSEGFDARQEIAIQSRVSLDSTLGIRAKNYSVRVLCSLGARALMLQHNYR